jgi:hypothetical protein
MDDAGQEATPSPSVEAAPGNGPSRRSVLKGGAAAGVAASLVGVTVGGDLAGANPIPTENALAGSPPSEWESGYSDTIVGYTPDFSVLPGATVRFKVKTDATSYRIRIYRIGWYGGLGARRVAELTPSVPLPQVQPPPIVDPVSACADCGNWATSATWTVPTTAVSGVYHARFERLDNGESNHAIFVVRSNTASDIVVQTSDTTWHAYNRYGGPSLYTGAAKVSYNRPLAPDEAENDFFSSEVALVRWLERNGFNTTYCTGVDAHADPAVARRGKVFISSGHDEYWSGPQRTNVEAARDAGVHLIFFSGNEVFWKIRFEPSIDGSNTANRTMVCYKETLYGQKTDPSPTWTGTWRDPRFSPPSDGGRPENALIGQLFRCINPVDAPDFAIEVPAEFARMRFWRNTRVASLLAGQKATLTGSTLGYEWDEVADNGFRPPGIIKLSRTTAVANQVLIDNGATYVPMAVTHNLSLYKAASGALVFGAGTVQWSYGLDDYHRTDRGVPTDTAIQQATVNLLADMGVQPASLQTGLVRASRSLDISRPTSAISAPAAGASLPVGSQVTVTGTASDVGGRVAGVEVSTDGGASWHPANGTTSWSYPFTPMTLGPISIRARAVDDSLNVQATPASRTVNGVQRAVPAALFPASILPATPSSGDANPIEVGMRFRPLVGGFITGARFYKGEGNTGTHVAKLWTNTGTLLATATFTNETASGWQTVSFPPVTVSAGTTYVVSVYMPNGNYAVTPGFYTSSYELWPLRGLRDGEDGANGVFRYGSAGFPVNTFGSSNYWVDPIFDSNNYLRPTVVDVAPGRSMQSVGTSSAVSAYFSENMNASSIVMRLAGPNGVSVAGTTSYDEATRRATFTPAAPLAPLTTYTASVDAARDTSGDALLAAYSWSFTTIGAPGSSPASLWDTSVTPGGSSADPYPVELGTRFTSDAAGQVTGLRFYKMPGSPGPHVGNLWDPATGALLASASFAEETTSGWQQVNLPAPVPIQANKAYVVSYHCPGGVYAADGGFFNTVAHRRGQLRAPASAPDGPNGVFRYGASAYPSETFAGSNYWADVVFDGAIAAPTVSNAVPAPGLVSVDPGRPVTATFNTEIDAPSLVMELRSPTGDLVPATVSYDAPSRTATLTPAAPLASAATYGVSVFARGEYGATPSAPTTWTFTTVVATGATPATLFTTADEPAVAANDDPASIEVGMRFTPDRDGVITAVRFYKGPGNGGTHVGRIWSLAGDLLGTATFSAETATGWQQATVASPVPVSAGTTYVVSYFAPQGRYSVTGGAFNSSVRREPLTAPASIPGAPNGVFAYGSGGFPTSSFGASNYFVDVVFADPIAPVVLGTSPLSTATAVSTTTTVSATFNEPVRTGDLVMELRDVAGTVVAGSVSYDAGTRTATFTPAGSLTEGTLHTASVQATDTDGNRMASATSWSFTTAGAELASLFPAAAVPAVASSGDATAVELGMKFRSDVATTVHGVRFYKGPGNTGSHVGRLWSADGQLLGQAAFSAETASGWQTALFASPVAIDPGTTYVVSYHAPNGNYSYDGGYFGSERVNGTLRGLENGAAGGNGVYLYGPGGFPTNSWGATNYWVDVLVES